MLLHGDEPASSIADNTLMNLLKAASTTSAWTLASRVTGLVRDVLINSIFGASALTDAFNVAFRIPNLFRRLFAEGAFTQAFVPLIAEAHATKSEAEQRHFLNAVATVLFWVLVVFSVIGVVGAPILVYMLASGFKHADTFDHAVIMTRIMFPYIACMSLVAFSAGILTTFKHFMVPAATPVLLNVCMIAAAWLLSPLFPVPIYALAVGVMIGGIVQLSVQLPMLAKHAMLPRVGLKWREAWRNPQVQQLLKLILPATLAVSVAQISLMINTQIASYLPRGSVTWLSNADRLMEFPTALIGVALGVVLMPSLMRANSQGNKAAYSSQLDWGLRLVLLLALPCAVALFVFAKPLVAVLFHNGKFTAHDVTQTALALSCYGVGLLGIVGVKVLAPGFYAKKDIATPVKIALIVLGATQVMNFFFVPWLKHGGLTLSIALGAMLNALLLYMGLRRRGSYAPLAGWGAFALKVAVAAAVMGVGVWLAAQPFDWFALQSNRLLRALLLGAIVLAAAVLYFALLAFMGIKPRQFIRHSS
jgi:putative peptidoglycan lipid II flippase